MALQNLVYNMYSLDLSKKNFISIADKNEKWYTPSGKMPDMAIKKGKDGRLEVDPEGRKKS